MGCEQSFRNICNDPKASNTIDNKSNPHHEFEFDHKIDKSTNRDNNNMTNRSDISENIFISTREELNKQFSLKKDHKFQLDLEKAKCIRENFESERSKDSLTVRANLSEIKDGIETSRRRGKAFIHLIKEFNFIHKLYRKCQISQNDYNSNKENEGFSSPRPVDISFGSNMTESLSVKSNYTVDSIQTEMSKFQIRSTILIDSKTKSKTKEFFSKVKNLVYIPIISITGEVNNSFILLKGDQSEKKMTLVNYTIAIPLSDNILTCLLNFVQNFHYNMNGCKIETNQNDHFEENSNSLVNLLNIIKGLNIEEIKFSFDLCSCLIDNDGLNFGIGVNVLKINSFIFLSKISSRVCKFLNDILSSDNRTKRNSPPMRLEEVFTYFTMKDQNIDITGYQFIFIVNTSSLVEITNFVDTIFLMLLDDNSDYIFKKIEEIINNFINVKTILISVTNESDNKIRFKSMSIKREVKPINMNNDKINVNSKTRTNSHYSNEIVKNKFERITFNINGEKNDTMFAYEYQL